MQGVKYALFFVPLCAFWQQAAALGPTTCGPITVDAPTMGVIGGAAAQQAAETEICNQINNKFQTANMTQVMSYMAKANALAGTGSVADYWSNPQVFTLGAGTTISVNNITPPFSLSEAESFINRYKDNPVPDGGTSVSANATLGISFRHMGFRKRGWFDPKNFNVYASVLVTPQVNYEIYSYKTTAVAGYIQYKAVQMRKLPFGLATWGGLDVGLGYSFASSTFGLSSSSVITSVPFSASGQTGSYNPTGTLTLQYASHLIPVEVSTNFSLLYFLSFAVGVAADFQIQSTAEVTANITGSVKIDGQAQGTDYARFEQSESAKFSRVGMRAFFGPQFNIWKIRIFTLAHINSDKSYASTIGVRFSW